MNRTLVWIASHLVGDPAGNSVGHVEPKKVKYLPHLFDGILAKLLEFETQERDGFTFAGLQHPLLVNGPALQYCRRRFMPITGRALEVLCGVLLAGHDRVGISNNVKVPGVGKILLDEGTDLRVAVLHGLFIANPDRGFGMRLRIQSQPEMFLNQIKHLADRHATSSRGPGALKNTGRRFKSAPHAYRTVPGVSSKFLRPTLLCLVKNPDDV